MKEFVKNTLIGVLLLCLMCLFVLLAESKSKEPRSGEYVCRSYEYAITILDDSISVRSNTGEVVVVALDSTSALAKLLYKDNE